MRATRSPEPEGGRASVTFLMTTAPIGAAPRQKQGNENRSKSSTIVSADSKQPISRGTPIDASMGLSRGFNRIMKMTRDELAEPDNQ
ncbi:hypothetical protein G5I_02518 [Acromyrmex echinatior]|uniref:Uncharacterized protein n=2 Tax=Attini TaxID=143999 RepID=F4WAI1_ACREC|nr:hypothetical protein G5I_02518 [Acromyrmex echinatior]